MNARFLGGLLMLSFGVAQANAQTETQPKTLIHARVTGYLEKVHVKPGALVKKGDLLFEIDAAMVRADLEQGRAEVAVAEAMLRRQTAEFERGKRLLEAKAVSREEYERMLSDLTIAEANLRVVRVRLDKLMMHVEFTKVRAPIDGIIQRPLQDTGSLLKADETLLAEIVQGPIKMPANIRELQKERFDELEKLVKVLRSQYTAGKVDFPRVAHAEIALIDAGLELAETPAQRIEHLRKSATFASGLLKFVEARFQAGAKDSEADLPQARAVLLEIRIRLLREEEKAGRK